MPSRFIGEIDARAARGWQGRWPAEATKATTKTNKDMRELAPLFADSAWLRLVSHTERKTERECLVLCLVLVMPFPTSPCRAEFAVASSRRVASQNNRAVIKKKVEKTQKKTTTKVALNLWIYQLHTRLAPGHSCTIKGANLARTTGHAADAKLTRIWSALATATATAPAPAPARAASRQTCARLLQGRQRGVIV